MTSKKFEDEFSTMLKSLAEAGYNNYLPNNKHKVLNAKDYGMCQNRERVFIVSIRKDIDDGSFKFPEPFPLEFKLQDILEPDAQLPILHNIYGGFNEKEARIFNEYSPTIRTAAGGGHITSVCTTDESKVEKIVDGYKIRTLTPLECWRLQGFSDEDFYKAKNAGVSKTQLYRQAGNSICKVVPYHIFKNLFHN